MEIVFDTYAWMEYFLDTQNAGIVEDYLNKEAILTPSIVLLELSYKADREGWDFKRLLNFIKLNSKIIGLNDSFVLDFGKVYNKLKKEVKKIGITDIIIIHTAKMYNAKILTGDEHFSKIDCVIMLK